MEFVGPVDSRSCLLTRTEAKALVKFTAKKAGLNLTRIMIDFGLGLAVATDGHKLLCLISPGSATETGQTNPVLIDRRTLAYLAKKHESIEIRKLGPSHAKTFGETRLPDGSVSRESKVDSFAFSFPNYQEVMRRTDVECLDRDRCGSLGVSGSLMTDVMVTLTDLCHTPRDVKARRDGVEIRFGRAALDVIRFDCVAHDHTRVVALLMPWTALESWGHANQAEYRKRIGDPVAALETGIAGRRTDRFTRLADELFNDRAPVQVAPGTNGRFADLD